MYLSTASYVYHSSWAIHLLLIGESGVAALDCMSNLWSVDPTGCGIGPSRKAMVGHVFPPAFGVVPSFAPTTTVKLSLVALDYNHNLKANPIKSGIVMEAVLPVGDVSTLVQSLSCLSMYADDIQLLVSMDSMKISATNLSKSVYGRLELESSFFSSYTVHSTDASSPPTLRRQRQDLQIKASVKAKLLLSYLRRATVERGVKYVKISIRDPSLHTGSSTAKDFSDDEDGRLETRLLLDFICEKDVEKRHRILLEDVDELLAPAPPEDGKESVVVLNNSNLRDLLGRIQPAAGKSDGQITCELNPTSMLLRVTADGAEFWREITAEGEDLERYDVQGPSITAAFHIREFAASLCFARDICKHLSLTFHGSERILMLDVRPSYPEEKELDNWQFRAYFATGPGLYPVTGRRRKRERDDEHVLLSKRPRYLEFSSGRSNISINSSKHDASIITASSTPVRKTVLTSLPQQDTTIEGGTPHNAKATTSQFQSMRVPRFSLPVVSTPRAGTSSLNNRANEIHSTTFGSTQDALASIHPSRTTLERLTSVGEQPFDNVVGTNRRERSNRGVNSNTKTVATGVASDSSETVAEATMPSNHYVQHDSQVITSQVQPNAPSQGSPGASYRSISSFDFVSQANRLERENSAATLEAMVKLQHAYHESVADDDDHLDEWASLPSGVQSDIQQEDGWTGRGHPLSNIDRSIGNLQNDASPLISSVEHENLGPLTTSSNPSRTAHNHRDSKHIPVENRVRYTIRGPPVLPGAQEVRRSRYARLDRLNDGTSSAEPEFSQTQKKSRG
ncbi:hypothetical protein CALCODRAFT_509368 [Calocera cornea HHB12733]|uniref:Rad9-domain-containing protein n=1 Tax=Calocera cornea HHB12733 TaxID=1353952 RepID=A0A165FDQ1_9BASI|nr:hypothetical protein CALCODRAFT_509368 [Calocera cornea HHB12733]